MNTNKPAPPRWANRLLHWYCAPHLLEEIEGDLQEEFDYQVKHYSITKARLDYIRSVIGFIKPFAIQRKSSSPNTTLSMNMLIHFLIVAFRNLKRHKSFSFINIAGLSLGMTCCIFIILWIRDERSMDNFHKDGDRLYNFYQVIRANGEVNGSYTTPVRYDKKYYTPFDSITKVIPDIKAINFYATGYEKPWGRPENFQVGDKLYKSEGSRTSSDFFNLFNYEVLAGDPHTALSDISSIAISRKMAEFLFDSPENAMGKTIRYENKLDLVVTAVFENIPVHSSLKFDFLLNWQLQMNGKLEWSSSNVLTTVKLSETAKADEVTVAVNRLLQAYIDKNAPFQTEIGLQPFRDLYLISNFADGKPSGGRIEYINIFSGVAVFILIIACINFMNLSTARSVKRAKEVGVRKVVGSSRSSLIAQFFGESVVLSFLALLLSLAWVALFLTPFNELTGKQITLPLTDLTLWLTFIALMLMTGIVAGSYPALFLSSLKPAGILKGVLRFTPGALWFRKGLAGFQFAISITLLIITIVMSRQTSYVQHTSLGYDRENLIYVPIEGELSNPQGYASLKQQLTGQPGIAMVDRCSEVPFAMNFVVDINTDGDINTNDINDSAIKWEGKEKNTATGFMPMSVGIDFIKLMDLKVIEGRGFSKEISTDTADAFLVNETAVKQMGMKDPIGKWISAWKKKGRIIGILKDYHIHSFHDAIKPLIIDVKEFEYWGMVLVRTEPGKTKEALASMEKVYKSVNPKFPFAYKFLDQEYEKMYRNEQVITKLSNAFAILAIGISCLGLLGLVMFSAEQRTKEFGIRKVLGASIVNIMGLLSKEFMILVAVSFCIAAPAAGYFMNQWLQGFAFKIPLSWWIFASAGAGATLIALLTICYQAIQSAIANPVKSLKAE